MFYNSLWILYFLQQFHSFSSYIKVFDPFLVDFVQDERYESKYIICMFVSCFSVSAEEAVCVFICVYF